jgi:hypothetical protein
VKASVAAERELSALNLDRAGERDNKISFKMAENSDFCEDLRLAV